MFALASILLSLLALSSASSKSRWSDTDQFHGKKLNPTNYTVIEGVFLQDSPTFNATGYNLLNDSFGLLDKSEGRWKNFTHYVTNLNKKADEHTTYKVVYLARHGEGYHNQAESYYGAPAWNCYWSLQNTDGNITWGPDAELTEVGVSQAQANNAAWKQQIPAGVPLPQTLYSSPMRRSAKTLQLTWGDILLNKGYVPYIKEHFRESLGMHTCDRRSTRDVIEQTFPGWHIDSGFAFHDQLWNAQFEEIGNQQALRVQQLLGEIFAEDSSTFISITAHSGVISAFFNVVGHRSFGVQTGGFVPMIIKAVSYPEATMTTFIGGQSKTVPLCTADPTSKVASPATVTAQPTWYPACSSLNNPAGSYITPTLPCTSQAVTMAVATSATATVTATSGA